MKGWQDPGTDSKLWLAGGAMLGALVLVWIIFSRPAELRVSSSGFNIGGQAAAPTRGIVERPVQPGLPFVSRESGQVQPWARPEAGGSGAGSTGYPSTSSGPAEDPSPPPSPDELRAAGIPSDASALARLVAPEGMLTAVAAKLLDHPRILRALLNNKLVVNAVMSRETWRRECGSKDSLLALLSDPTSPFTANTLSMLQSALTRPQSASTLAGTEMAQRVVECPSVRALSEDPMALISVTVSNPKIMDLLTDQRATQALVSNPRALGLLTGVQSAVGGSGAPVPR